MSSRKWLDISKSVAAVAAPKICRERERKGRKGKKEREREREREREEKRQRKREGEQEACVVGVNTSFELLQNCKRHGKKEGVGRENPGKRLVVKDVRRDRNGRRKYSDRRQIEMSE